MTKVCHIITSLSEGGAQKILTSLALNSNKHNQFIISLKKGGRYTKILKQKNIKVFQLDFQERKLKSLFYLSKIIEDQKPEIVQTWMYHSDIVSLYLFCTNKLSSKYLYWNIRNGSLKEDSSKFLTRFIRRILILLSYFLPDKIIYCSKECKFIHEKLGYDPKKSFLIENGVNTKKFKPLIINNEHRKDLYVIGSAARFAPQKNLNLLFSATSKLLKKGFNIKLYLCGEGMNQSNYLLYSQLEKLGIHRNTELLGIVEDMQNFYNSLDLFVSTSKSGEGFSNVIIEALSCGIRCISSDIGSARDLLKEVGWLVPLKEDDIMIENFTNNIKESFFELAYERQDKESKGRELIKNHYSEKIMLQKYNQIYIV